jgi:hypothetical protein
MKRLPGNPGVPPNRGLEDLEDKKIKRLKD